MEAIEGRPHRAIALSSSLRVIDIVKETFSEGIIPKPIAAWSQVRTVHGHPFIESHQPFMPAPVASLIAPVGPGRDITTAFVFRSVLPPSTPTISNGHQLRENIWHWRQFPVPSLLLRRSSTSCLNRWLDLCSIMAILPKCPARSGSSFLTWKNPDSSTEGAREAIETLNIARVLGLRFPVAREPMPIIIRKSSCAEPSPSAKHETNS